MNTGEGFEAPLDDIRTASKACTELVAEVSCVRPQQALDYEIGCAMPGSRAAAEVCDLVTTWFNRIQSWTGWVEQHGHDLSATANSYETCDEGVRDVMTGHIDGLGGDERV